MKETFSCKDREYGYYADIENNCEIFHVCMPLEGDTNFQQWSFLCGNQTIFDQQTLTCNYVADSFPCEEAESLYGSVEFGKVNV